MGRGRPVEVAAAGWQAVTVDARGHGESDWADGDYRLSSFAADVVAVAAALDRPPVLVGASLGGLTAMLLEGELAPGTAAGVVLVDIIPEMEQAGADRIQAFMSDKVDEGFGSLEEVADAIAAYNPHRPRPDDLDGLRKNLRERDGRWYLALGSRLRRRHRRLPAGGDHGHRASEHRGRARSRCRCCSCGAG